LESWDASLFAEGKKLRKPEGLEQPFRARRMSLITNNFEKELKEEWFGIKRKIKFIPLWKWLLDTKNKH